MKAYELMDDLYNMAKEKRDNNGCDQLIAGDPEKEIKKVAVCCIATTDVIRQAGEFGADILVTHEPTLASHWDKYDPDDELVYLKMELIKKYNLTVYRFHDNIHARRPDMINEGELNYLGWKGTFDGGTDFTLDEPKTLIELAKDIEDKLGIKHVKMVGDSNLLIKNISLSTGARGLEPTVRNNKYQMILAGEIVEWRDAEYIRDAAQLGLKKSMLVLGHIGSERDGMKYLSEYLIENYKELEIKYIDSGEVYHYTENN